MDIVNLKFKRDHADWVGEIEIDLLDPGSFAVLVGKNAGGKSLALKAIEKFTNLLRDPNSFAKDDFEKLAKAASISEIHATYRGNISQMRDLDGLEVKIEDRSSAKSVIRDEKCPDEQCISYCEIVNWEIVVEKRFKMRKNRSEEVKMEYVRRYGNEVKLFWEIERNLEESGGEVVREIRGIFCLKNGSKYLIRTC